MFDDMRPMSDAPADGTAVSSGYARLELTRCST